MPLRFPEEIPFTAEELKEILGTKKISTFTDVVLEREKIRSDHSDLYVLLLSGDEKKGWNKKEKIIAKRFIVPYREGQELAYLQEKRPEIMLQRQERAEKLIYKASTNIVPKPLGTIRSKNVYLMKFLEGRTLDDVLSDISNELHEKKEEKENILKKKRDILQGAVKNLARFDSIVNSKRMRAIDLPQQEEELDHRLYNQHFISYLARLSFNNKELIPAEVETYEYERVVSILKDKGIDLQNRVKDIMSIKKKAFLRPNRYAHGDYNPRNIFYPAMTLEVGLTTPSTVIDLEKFGLHSETRDLTSLFMGGVDNISVPESSSYLIGLITYYLAYKNIYTKNVYKPYRFEKKGINHIDSLNAEETYKFLIKAGNFNNAQYAEFMLNFFANSIEEGIHLHATYRRYKPDHLAHLIGKLKNYSVENLLESKKNYSQELFKTVSQIPFLFSHLDEEQATAMRNYFHSLASLMNDLGVFSLDNETLSDLRDGGAVGKIYGFLHPTPSDKK